MTEKMKSSVSWIIYIVVAVVIAVLLRIFVLEIVHVKGDSMLPTLSEGEVTFTEKVSKHFGLPKRGDVVVVHYPIDKRNYIKRVIALPGEEIEIKNSLVYIDGDPIEENYISDDNYYDYGPFVVPEDSVFVMGDNRLHSMDSRDDAIGPVPKDDIVGHAMAIIFPFNKIKGIN